MRLPLTQALPRQPDATDRFRKIKAAYTTLSDPAARSQYDRRSQGACRWAAAGFGFRYGRFFRAARAHAVRHAGAASSWGRSSGGASGGGGGGFDFDFGAYGRSANKSGPAEEFYGLGDFFRDLDKEISSFEVRAP